MIASSHLYVQKRKVRFRLMGTHFLIAIMVRKKKMFIKDFIGREELL